MNQPKVNDITKNYSLEFWEYLEKALNFAKDIGQEKANIWHFLYVVLSSERIHDIADVKTIKLDNLISKNSQMMGKVKKVNVDDELYKFILYVSLITKKNNRIIVHLEDAFLAFLTFPSTSEPLKPFISDIDKISQKIVEKIGGGVNSASNTEDLGSYLKKYTIDLEKTQDFSKFTIIGRQNEISQVVRIFSRESRTSVVLMGEQGVGKSMVAKAFISEIVSNSVPQTLDGCRVLTLNLSALTSASQNGREHEIFSEIIQESKNLPTIFYFEDLHTLSSGFQNSELSSMKQSFRSAIINGEIRVLGSTNISNFKRYIEQDTALYAKLEVVKVDEPSDKEVVEICKLIVKKLEEFHHVTITDEAIQAAVDLSKKYITEKFFPQKAIDLLDESSTTLKKKDEQVYITPENIREILSSKTGIPIQNLTQDDKTKLLNMEEVLNENVLGQKSAVHHVSEVIQRSRAGLKDPKKPIGTFLFLGPSGVGKTELAKIIAQVVYDTPKAMIRLDMSEFSESHTVQRLVGSPPGYIGYEEGGQLTNPVWERPYSLILLDEIEKAHPKVFDIFLQVLDDGRLTDGQGRTVDFRNTIIIATSNIGSDVILAKMGFHSDENVKSISLADLGLEFEPEPIDRKKKMAEALGFKIPENNQNGGDLNKLNDKPDEDIDEPENEPQEVPMTEIIPILKQYFRPEFINRFDDILVFNPLTKSALKSICLLNIKKIEDRLKEKKIKIKLKDETLNAIVNEAYQPQFGARPLLRIIKEKIENVIAKGVISGSIIDGATIEL